MLHSAQGPARNIPMRSVSAQLIRVCCFLVMGIFAAAASQVGIQGTVRDKQGAPIQGAVVWIKWLNMRDTTDGNGIYRIGNPVSIGGPKTERSSISASGINLRMDGGNLRLFVPAHRTVSVAMNDLTGRSIMHTGREELGPGWHSLIRPDGNLAHQATIASIAASDGARLRALVLPDANGNTRFGAAMAIHDGGLARIDAGNDTLIATCRMYKAARLPMTSMQGVHDFTLDARETSARFTGMKYIYGGTFDMGMAGIAEPVHKVTLSPFYIDSTEVTQADYKALIGSDPSQYANHPLNPVEEVTMFDIVLYCNERSKREGRDTVYTYTAKTGTPQIGLQNLDNFVIYYDRAGYRLPTEAEWEYACRAGSGTKFYWGDVPSLDYCWAQNNAGGHTNQVATKKANAWGLYDMIGNDWEYCTDLDTVYTSASQTDPVGAATGWRRQLRGGAWHEAYDHPWMYCANRHSEVPTCRDNNVGFRCVFPDM